MNLCSLSQRQSFMEEKLYCIYGGIIIIFILRFYTAITQCKLIISTSATCVWKSRKKKKKHLALIKKRNFVLLYDNKATISKNHMKKIFDLAWSVLPPPLFILYKMLWMTKDFLTIKWKYLQKTSAWNQQNFSWEEQISYQINGEKQFKINGKYTIVYIIINC